MNEIKETRVWYEHQKKKPNIARVEISLKGRSEIFHLLIPLILGWTSPEKPLWGGQGNPVIDQGNGLTWSAYTNLFSL